MNESNANTGETLVQKLNRDTARINWRALEKHHKEGSVIIVDNGLDLIAVATDFSLDNTTKVKNWLAEGLVAKASEEQAAKWQETDREVWAVVVAPWILVQEEKLAKTPA